MPENGLEKGNRKFVLTKEYIICIVEAFGKVGAYPSWLGFGAQSYFFLQYLFSKIIETHWISMISLKSRSNPSESPEIMQKTQIFCFRNIQHTFVLAEEHVGVVSQGFPGPTVSLLVEKPIISLIFKILGKSWIQRVTSIAIPSVARARSIRGYVTLVWGFDNVSKASGRS